jgi:Domain of unknown function (DUF1771)
MPRETISAPQAGEFGCFSRILNVVGLAWGGDVTNLVPNIGALNNEVRAKTEERKRTLEEAYRLKAQVEVLRPQVDTLQNDADALAVQFKEKYDEASAAYENGDGELAKEHSLEGHEIQELCEAANQQTNELRSVLHNCRRKMLEHFDKAKLLEREIHDLRERLDRAQRRFEHQRRNTETQRHFARSIVLSGLAEEEILSIRAVLGTFPMVILQKLDRIIYSPQMMRGGYGRPITGRTRRFPGGKYFMELFGHDPRFAERITDTVAHELGHIAFPLLSAELRKEWDDLYATTEESRFVTHYAIRGGEEDFCECLALFTRDPDILAAKDKRKYAFLKRLREKDVI